MSVNFNGGMKAQGFGGVKPNANPTINDKNNTITDRNMQEGDNNRQEGSTETRRIVITKDENGYHTHIEDGNPHEVELPNGDIIDLKESLLNGQEATEGEIWHALMVGLGYFD